MSRFVKLLFLSSLLISFLSSCRQTEENQVEYVNSTIAQNGCTSFQRTLSAPLQDVVFSIKEIPSGGYILCGTTSSNNASLHDAFVIKLDCFGEIEWAKLFGQQYYDRSFDIEPTADGGFILTSISSTTGDEGGSELPFVTRLLKISSSGDQIWEKTIGLQDQTIATNTLELTSGSFLSVGYTSGYLHPNEGLMLKTTPQGNSYQQFYIQRRESESVKLSCLTRIVDGKYVACGLGTRFGESYLILSKLGESGDTTWVNRYPNDINYDLTNLCITSTDDKVVVSGNKYLSQSQSYVSVLAWFDLEGNLIQKSEFTDGWLFGSIVGIGNDVVATGHKFSEEGVAYLRKLDVGGNTIWERSFAGGKPNSRIKCIGNTQDGGFIAAGFIDDSNSFFGDGYEIIPLQSDCWVIKTDATGN